MSDSIDLGLRMKDFSKQSDFAEYENVELYANDEVSVKAKATGSLFADNMSWATTGKSAVGEVITTNSEIKFVSYGSSGYGIRAYAKPAKVKYIDVIGQQINFSMHVSEVSGNDWHICAGVSLHSDEITVGNRISFKDFSQNIGSGDYNFSFVVGDWFKSNYENAYLTIYLYFLSDTAGAANVSNIKFYINEDQEKTLVAKCPWATSAISRQVLESLKGFHYRPYEAKGARLDPSAELGDNMVIDYTGYGIYSQTAQFNSEFVSNLSAPFEEDIDHEFPYVPSTERRFTREIRTLKAELIIAAEQIEAKVSSVEGSQATFGWTLQKDNFTVYAGGRVVLKVTQSGAEISGKVVATSGTIGGCEIVNGILQVNSANIREINADRITVGTLSAERIQDLSIQSNKLANGAVTETKIGSYAVTGGAISGGAVSLGKFNSALQGGFAQIGVNQSDIAAINKKFITALSVVGLEVTGGGIIVKHNGRNRTFQPMAKNSSAIAYVLGATS